MVSLPVRRVSFDPLLDDLPDHLGASGDLATSHVIAVLSSIFPDGESYFVRSVNAVREEIDDPDLGERLHGFAGQEARHGRAHRDLNRRLADKGYPTDAIERYVKWVVSACEKRLSPVTNVAFTAGLEHYTATIAEQLLRDPDARAEIGHDGVRELFLWHALEESEHKSVAFDVYRALGGSDRLRIVTMNLINLGFVCEVSTWTLISMIKDPAVREDPRAAMRSVWRLRRSPFMSRWARRRILDYNRRDFHPDDHDTTGLVDEWRARLFGARGELTDLVAT